MLTDGHAPETVMAGAFGLGAVAAPAGARASPAPAGSRSPAARRWSLFLGVVPTAARLPAVRARPKRLLSAAETATLTLAEPLTAALLGVIVLSERMSRARGARRAR